MTCNGLVRSQGAGCNFLCLFICINQEFGARLSPGFLAGSRHCCLTAAPGGMGQARETPPAQRPDVHNETKISIVLFLQVFHTSVDVKSSKFNMPEPYPGIR